MDVKYVQAVASKLTTDTLVNSNKRYAKSK